MRVFQLILLVLFVSVIAACSSGGSDSGSSTSISLNKSNLSFTSVGSGGDVAEQVVSASFVGDGVIVGYPTNVQEEDWLYVNEGSYTTTSADFTVGINVLGLAPGTYTTTLRFLTGREDGTGAQYKDLPVTYTVLIDDGSGGGTGEGTVTSSSSSFDFSAVGSYAASISPSEGYAINFTGDDVQWTISSDVPWLQVDKTSLSGAGTVLVTATSVPNQYGISNGTITVSNTDGVTSYFNATMTSVEVRPVIETSVPVVQVLAGDGRATQSLTLGIADELDGASAADAFSWALTLDGTSWVTLSSPTGSTADGKPTAELDLQALRALGGGLHFARITVDMENSSGTKYSETISVQAFVEPPAVDVVTSVANLLDFQVTDMAVDATGGRIYISDSSAKRVYVVNLGTGLTESYFEFELIPESLTVSADGTKVYIALLDSGHEYNSNEPESGAISVLDTQSNRVDFGFHIDLDPFDLVVNSDHKLVVTSGSNQWTNIQMYNGLTGEFLSQADIRHQSYLNLHPSQNWIFSADTGSSPSDIELFTIDSDNLTASGDSPYHGEYRMNGRVWSTPDGMQLITAGGDVFVAPSMMFVQNLTDTGIRISNMDFDAANGVAYAQTGTQEVTRYNTNDLSVIEPAITATNDIAFIFVASGVLYAITENGGVNYLEAL